MNVNRCFLLGNLTRDPELKALTNGGSIATFTLATNRRVKKGDEKVEEAEYHNVVVFGKAPNPNCPNCLGFGFYYFMGWAQTCHCKRYSPNI